ncbi:ATP-dependent DNA ligase [Paenibacillus cremeus]|uniref:ATP-dependent DNA ligase family profile domain-containing protein n=1 Tax=Paenibacillus cremeus TaxID=2163881 RepID=A0A559K7K5_9BACL|nr:hypothetical protein [Paenibacillus cremeus]TVY08120.1 hypothetical protein FPZ49_20435 [Paenibacillus cremeus]
MLNALMLPEMAEQPFSDDSYVFEPMFEGHRLILKKQGVETRLWTRQKVECTRQYPELHTLGIKGDVVLDGEVCYFHPESGEMDAAWIKRRLQLHNKKSIATSSRHRPVTYMVWDILFYNGRDLRNLPLLKRRSILESVLESEESVIRIVPQLDGCGDELWKEVQERSMKGMIAKRKTSVYTPRHSKEWLQVLNEQYGQYDVDVAANG